VKRNANCWRVTDDMWDDWSFVKKTFAICRDWQGHNTSNQWPDCDAFPFGKLRINGSDGALAGALKIPNDSTKNEFSRLTIDEKYTMVTLWCIFRSPLMMGGELMENDKHLLSLLTNKEVLAIDQKSANNHELRATANEVVWVADDPASGGKYVALFNIGDTATQQIKVSWDELGIKGEYTVRDLWQRKNIGTFKQKFEGIVSPHGATLLKISK
jgi:alpha-galactosidase